jgi:hypothetical protein
MLLKNSLKNSLKILIHFGLIEYLKKFHNSKTSYNKIGLVAIVKNESEYIVEWIEYHISMGVNVIYIYDNDSIDNLFVILEKYINKGIVVYKKFPGKGVQEKAYLDAILVSQNTVDWLICIDIDEFIQPLGRMSISNWLNAMPDNVSQVELGWMLFGSSGFLTKPKGMVIENYLYHATDNFITDYKPIVRPKKVFDMEFPHQFMVAGRTVDENIKTLISYPFNYIGAEPSSKNKFRVNHYYSKSLEEFNKKALRGDASVPDRKPRGIKEFEEHDRNEVFDNSMLKYVNNIKRKLEKCE